MGESISSIEQEFEAQTKSRTYSSPAKRLMEKLAPLSSHVEAYQKRWFWEMLQNACDYNESVKLQVEVTNDYVYIRHNGKAFTITEAMNLIFPDSDKDEDENSEVIGQFGTGFISTHILSAEITVSGTLLDKDRNEHDFEFTLNREERANKAKLIDDIQIAEAKLKKIDGTPKAGSEFTTEFAYKRSASYLFADSTETIEKGIEFITKAIPYVFAFSSKLLEVTLVSPNTKHKFTAETENNCTTCRHLKLENEVPTSDKIRSILTHTVDNITVAVHLDNGEVQVIPDGLPRIFKAYPMIGSEGFPFPCIVHSNLFTPTTEREGVELSENDPMNRTVFETATKAFHNMVEHLTNDDCTHLHNMCKLEAVDFKEEKGKWFKEKVVNELKTSILTFPLIKTESGERKRLSDIKIPVAESEHFDAFFDLIHETKIDVPSRGETQLWKDTLNFSMFTELQFDLNKLISTIVDNNTMQLQEGVDAVEWLKTLVGFILETERGDLLLSKNVICLKNNTRTSRKSELFWDGGIDGELKDIYACFSSKNYNAILLHDSLKEFGDKLLPLENNKSEQDINDAIDKAMREYQGERANSQFLEGLQKLLEWTDNIPDEELANKFPYFHTNKALLIVETLASPEKRDMAFRIVKSGKMQVLSQLADSEITNEQLERVADNPKEFEQFLKWKNSKVDDEENADEGLGNIGEEFVYKKLMDKYGELPDYEVEWVAQTRKEPNYDFEVRKNGQQWLFIDAKTTGKGIANSDTVPFFMRRGQWDFLPTLADNQMYFLARVFMHNGLMSVRFLKIKSEESV